MIFSYQSSGWWEPAQANSSKGVYLNKKESYKNVRIQMLVGSLIELGVLEARTKGSQQTSVVGLGKSWLQHSTITTPHFSPNSWSSHYLSWCRAMWQLQLFPAASPPAFSVSVPLPSSSDPPHWWEKRLLQSHLYRAQWSRIISSSQANSSQAPTQLGEPEPPTATCLQGDSGIAGSPPHSEVT